MTFFLPIYNCEMVQKMVQNGAKNGAKNDAKKMEIKMVWFVNIVQWHSVESSNAWLFLHMAKPILR